MVGLYFCGFVRLAYWLGTTVGEMPMYILELSKPDNTVAGCLLSCLPIITETLRLSVR